MTIAGIDKLIQEWRARGPVNWAQGPHGWIGIDGKPITLSPWQSAVLSAWWDNRETVTTLAISNIKKTGKTFSNSILTAWRWLALPGKHYCVANDLDQAQSLVFQEIAEMCRRNSFLRDQVTITRRKLEFTPTGSTLEAITGQDAPGVAGSNHLTS